MLVLSRKGGETIVIGGDIEIRILSVTGNRVSVGVVAPDGVRIMREELVRRIAGDYDHAEYMDKPLEVPGRKFARSV